VRMYDYLRPLRESEAIIGLVWSPDKRRLLIRSARTMGEADLEEGPLWCFRLADAKTELLTDEPVTRAGWSGKTRVRYWTAGWGRDPRTQAQIPLPEKSHQRKCR
jgi:hypothetical protein